MGIMKLNINQMIYEEAKQISKWIYEEPYSIYNMDASDSCMKELLNGYYFSVTDEENSLIGYYCFGESAQVPAGKKFGVYTDNDLTDIGLGIKPSLCGQKFGIDFLSNGIEFARKKFSTKGFRLTVASFNKRAIKVYERTGFRKDNSFIKLSQNRKIEFWVMTLCTW